MRTERQRRIDVLKNSANFPKHRHVGAGLCPICRHNGDDCIGERGKLLTSRAMVPVLLCFNVYHARGAGEREIRTQARRTVQKALGAVGEEENAIRLELRDPEGRGIEAKIFPSDFESCDTLNHIYNSDSE